MVLRHKFARLAEEAAVNPPSSGTSLVTPPPPGGESQRVQPLHPPQAARTTDSVVKEQLTPVQPVVVPSTVCDRDGESVSRQYSIIRRVKNERKIFAHVECSCSPFAAREFARQTECWAVLTPPRHIPYFVLRAESAAELLRLPAGCLSFALSCALKNPFQHRAMEPPGKDMPKSRPPAGCCRRLRLSSSRWHPVHRRRTHRECEHPAEARALSHGSRRPVSE
jgi:hypothetical protein